MSGAVVVVVALVAFAVLGGKKKPKAGGTCFEEAAQRIAERLLWTDDGEKLGLVGQLQAAGLTKAASCVALEGEDLLACIPMLSDALVRDLLEMQTTSAPHRAEVRQRLEAHGFPEGAACFR